jgi:hypothetical protein
MIAVRLRRRWNVADAAVLSDWCDQHGLIGTARALRRGPSVRTLVLVTELCRAFGAREREGTWNAYWAGWRPPEQA